MLYSLLVLILIIAVVGVVLWLIEKYLPMSPIFRDIIRAVVAIVLIIVLINWLMRLAGGGPLLPAL